LRGIIVKEAISLQVISRKKRKIEAMSVDYAK